MDRCTRQHQSAGGYLGRRVDPAAAREVAAACIDEPSRRDPLTAATHTQLITDCDRLFRWSTS
jgi:hypothetical protein